MNKDYQIRLEDHLCTKLYIASRLILQGYAEKFSPLGLTYPKYLVLLALDEKNGQTVGELGNILSLDSGTLSPLLQSLDKQKFVQRRRLETDERTVANFITPKGKQTCKEARKVAIELFEKTGMTETQLVHARKITDDFIERCKNLNSKKLTTKEKKMSKINRSLLQLFIVAYAFTGNVMASSNYSKVWSEVKSNTYGYLPKYQTTFSSLKKAGENLIFNSAVRTLNNKSDLLPYFQKLVHPIGICFSGTWTIDQPSKYTGYYAEGKQGLIIARASEAMGNPNFGDWRAFGIAGKIYPTDNINDSKDYQTANFFTVDDLGGTDEKSFLALPKSNEPALSIHLNSLLLAPLITRITKAFKSADSNPGFRPLYEVSELGMDHPEDAVTPQWMQLVSEGNTPLVRPAKDFRQELHLRNFEGKTLKFGIYVSDAGEKNFKRLGQIEFTDEASSISCDHRLHFSHPKLK